MRCNPWRWLWGLIPVAILAFLTVQWEHDRIETDLRQRTETALNGAGLKWAVTAFDGRDGLITGQASSDDAPQRALKVVRDVWGVRITDQRTNLLQRIDPYIWSAALRGGRIKLAGYVPSDEVRTEILGLAKAAFPNREIDDRLELARGVPERDIWLGGIGFGMKQLSAMRSGSIAFSNTALTIEGEAEDIARYKSVKGALRGGLPTGVTLVAEKVTPPVVTPYKWAARRSGNQLQLDGFVPDEALREQVFTHAKKTFPKLAIVDRLEVGLGAPAGLSGLARAALDQLALLEKGEVVLVDKSVKVSGHAPDEATASNVVKSMRGAAQGLELSDAITFPKPQPPAVSPYIIKIEHLGSGISLTGYVPSEAVRGQLVAATRKRFPDRDIRDQLQLAAGEPPGLGDCFTTGLGALGQLESGAMTITDSKMVLTGVTRQEALLEKLPAEVRAQANRACEANVQLTFDAPPEPDLTWRAAFDGEKSLTIEGQVIDARTRAAIVQSATRYFPNSEIADRMTIAGGASAKWPVAADLGLKLLSQLRKGEAVLSRQELVMRGEAKDTGVQTSVRDQLGRGIPKGYTARDIIEVRSDAMIWAEQEASRKAAEQQAKERAAAEAASRQKAAPATPVPPAEVQKRKEEANACQRLLRDIATTGTIRFDWASANLDRASRPTLDKLAEVSRACPNAKIDIEGHTDAEGTPERNKSLSERRAQAVADYLVGAGIAAQRLRAVGYGETRPIAPNDTAVNRAKNRRIEFSARWE